nr:chorismate synthase [uncultured Tyzzerella sp.]
MKEGDIISGSTFGNIFKISTWGESHGKAMGVVIDGCPAGVYICEDDIQKELDKRKPNNSKYATKRAEEDKVIIMSGIFEGKTTGTPISLIVHNKDYISKDYTNIKDIYRPSHADFTYDRKYGFRDYRGGGRASARETVARVCAGAIAKKILTDLGINILAYTSSVGNIKLKNIDLSYINENPLKMPCKEAVKEATTFLDNLIKEHNSIGGTAHCEIDGLKAGIGEPVFEKLDAMLSMAIMSIGATKGIEFGLGFLASEKKASEYNDIFYNHKNKIDKKTNNSGGILGGISDSSKITINIAFKPTPSISIPQNTINTNLENENIVIKGRHDPFIVPRAIPIIESMVAITLLDYILINTTKKIECIKYAYLNF